MGNIRKSSTVEMHTDDYIIKFETKEDGSGPAASTLKMYTDESTTILDGPSLAKFLDECGY